MSWHVVRINCNYEQCTISNTLLKFWLNIEITVKVMPVWNFDLRKLSVYGQGIRYHVKIAVVNDVKGDECRDKNRSSVPIASCRRRLHGMVIRRDRTIRGLQVWHDV